MWLPMKNGSMKTCEMKVLWNLRVRLLLFFRGHLSPSCFLCHELWPFTFLPFFTHATWSRDLSFRTAVMRLILSSNFRQMSMLNREMTWEWWRMRVTEIWLIRSMRWRDCSCWCRQRSASSDGPWWSERRYDVEMKSKSSRARTHDHHDTTGFP